MSAATVVDRHGGIHYRGRRPDTIVRSIWGRRAELIPSGRQGGARLGMVVRRSRYGTKVLAEVAYYGGAA